jgi:PAS domain S-box-containing protein
MSIGEQRQIDQERLSWAMLEQIRQSMDLNEILETTVTKVRQFLACDRVIIYRFNPDWSGVVVAESVEVPWTSTLDKTITDPCFQKNWVELYKKGRVKAIANIHDANLDSCHIQLLAKYQVQANMVVPILQSKAKDWDTIPSRKGQDVSIENRLWGLLIAHHCASPRQWELQETDLLFSLSSQVALAIQQAELYQQAQTEVFRQRRMASQLSKLNRSVKMLLECNKLLVQATDESKLLQDICQIVIAVGGYQLAWIGLTESQAASQLRIRGQAFEPGEFENPPIVESQLANLDSDFIAQALDTSEPSFIRNLKLEATGVQHNYAVAIALPLHSEGISGVLTIYSKQANAFDVAEVELLKELAETLSHGLMTLRARSLLKQTNEQLRREICDRKQAEAALQESYNLLRSVINASSDPIFVTDRQGCFKLINASGASLFNKSVEEIRGQDSSVLLPPEVYAQHQANDQKVITSGKSDTSEATFVVQGEAKTYLITKNVYSDQVGNILGLVGFTKDITSLKQTQNALREANNDLEQRVQARTAELSQANAELARSNTELEQFAYIASHDLREPLRKIKSYVELLAENYQGQLDDTADKYITYVTDGATRMQALIADLLTYSRVGQGNLTLEPTDLGTVLEQTLGDLSVTIEENSALITADPLPTVRANAQQIAQLFLNLIGNAIKFQGKATPKIEVKAELQECQWLIAVRDNGIGIKPQYAERIFEIFQRLHSREKYAGTGIGLAICRKIVERHGGRIWMESQLGLGTTFYFTLPASVRQPKTPLSLLSFDKPSTKLTYGNPK